MKRADESLPCYRLTVAKDPIKVIPPPTSEAERAILDKEARAALRLVRLDSRAEVERNIEKMIKTMRERSLRAEAQIVPSVLAAIVGEWGSGKSYYTEYVREMAEGQGLNAQVYAMDDILNAVYREYEAAGTITRARAREVILDKILPGREAELPKVVIIDEVESAIRAALLEKGEHGGRVAVAAFFDIIKFLLNPEIEEEALIRGRLHMVLMLTPAARQLIIQYLTSIGVAGKYMRRFEFVIRLEPLMKHDALRLIDAYLRSIIGIGIEDFFSDTRLAEIVYAVAGGNPGRIIRLLGTIIRANICPEGGKCVCRVSPERLLTSLSEAELTNELGQTYVPIESSTASALLNTLLNCREALLLVASGSALTESEWGAEMELCLQRAGLRSSVVRGLRLGDEKSVGLEVSAILSSICGNDANCRLSLMETLSFLIHYVNGEYFLTIPDQGSELLNWLEHMGWIPFTKDMEEAVKGLVKVSGKYRKLVVLPPHELSRVYSIYPAGVLSFIKNPAIRALVREELRKIEAEPSRFSEYVAAAIVRALNYSAPSNCRIDGRGHQNSVICRINLDENLMEFTVRVEPYSLLSFETTLKLCSADPQNWASIIIAPLPEQVTVPASPECPNVIWLPLSQGTQRRLAIYEIAARSHMSDIDTTMFYAGIKTLADRFGLIKALRSSLRNMIKAGRVVLPTSEAIKGVSGIVSDSKVGSPVQFLGDMHKLLIMAGGRSEPVSPKEITDLILTLSKATPFANHKIWCGLKLIGFSVLDIKDEPPKNLRTIVETGLRYLRLEGLAKEDGNEYIDSTTSDPIASYILDLLDRGVRVEELKERPEKYFILPLSEFHRTLAKERIRLRLEALAHIGRIAGIGRSYWGKLEDYSRPCKIHDIIDPCHLRVETNTQQLIARIHFEYNNMREAAKHAGLPPPPIDLIKITICKKKKCKHIDLATLRALKDKAISLGNVCVSQDATQTELVAIHHLTGLLCLHAYIISLHIRTLTGYFQNYANLSSSLHEGIKNVLGLLDEIRKAGVDEDVIEGLTKLVEEADPVAYTLKTADSLRSTYRIVKTMMTDMEKRNISKFRPELEQELHFGRCDGFKQLISNLGTTGSYSVLLYFIRKELKEGKLEELRNLNDSVRKLGRELHKLLKYLMKESAFTIPDAPKIVTKHLRNSLEYSGDLYSFVENVLSKVLDKIEAEISLLEESSELVKELNENIAEIDKRITVTELSIKRIRETIKKVSELSERTEVNIEKALHKIEGEVAELIDHIDMRRRDIDWLKKDKESGKCTGTTLESCLRRSREILRYVQEIDDKIATLENEIEGLRWRIINEVKNKLKRMDAMISGLIDIVRAAPSLPSELVREAEEAIKKAKDVTRGIDPERDPVAASEAASSAVRIIEEVMSKLEGISAVTLYKYVKDNIGNEMGLEELINRIRKITDLEEGIEKIVEIADRLGVDIVVSIRPRE